jgi:type VI secretion system protein ImpJ
MPQYHKILWSEGLFLTQHHFQQFDAYHEADRSFQRRTTNPFGWGVAQLVIDAEAVDNRQFTLTEFEGIFPDGSSVRTPALDDPPPSRHFDDLFSPTQKVLSVYLGLPRFRPGTPGTALGQVDAANPTRYQQAFATVADEVTGENEREIPYAKKQLTILFSGEDIEGYDTIKIAEIERSPEGATRLRGSYIPPALAVSASGFLTAELRGLLETASAKSESLSDQVRQRTQTLTEVSTSDLPNYLKLLTVNTYVPLLAHWQSHPRIHPVQLYEGLAQFTGNLCVFKVGEHPRDLPVYQHDDLENSFVPLIAKLRELLEVVVEERFSRIGLERIDASQYSGTISDPSLFETFDFYLGVEAGVSESQLASEFPKHAKVISPEMMPRLIGGNLPGANLIFVQLPPAALPRRAGVVYFRIDQRGDRWDFIQKAAAIAIYAPPATFPDWTIECIAVEKA